MLHPVSHKVAIQIHMYTQSFFVYSYSVRYDHCLALVSVKFFTDCGWLKVLVDVENTHCCHPYGSVAYRNLYWLPFRTYVHNTAIRVTLYSFASTNCLLPLAILLAMHLIPMKGETVGTLGHQNWAYMTVGCMCMVGGHYLGS